ncbi:MAG TPA: site-2 protease family protein, partial [Bacteroidia bacterium]|nr:site-2 protease family protein [Bacteroidia bacterium]
IKNLKYGIYVDPIAEKIGLKNGDKILSLDNVAVEDFHKVSVAFLLDQPKSIQVERDGLKKDIPIPAGLDLKAIGKEVMLIGPGFPFVIDSVTPETGAAFAGLKKGDSLISINKDTMPFYQQYAGKLESNKGKWVHVGYKRNGQMRSDSVMVSDEGKLGVFPKGPDEFLRDTTIHFGFFSAWGEGWRKTTSSLSNYVKQFRLIFTRVGASKMGGFGSIAKIYPSEWDWEQFWITTATISLILAFMNLLPIPVLDGGYILFVLWEMITRKKVSDKFMQRALTIGMYFVLALLIYSNGNDIVRAFK